MGVPIQNFAGEKVGEKPEIVNMETLGMNLSEKQFFDITDHDLLDVWESDMGSVRTS